MRYKAIILAIIAVIFTASSAFSADIKEIRVQTNLTCESCKTKIEKKLDKVEGIINSDADVSTKVVKIKYDADKVNESKITNSISDLGYDAELIKATSNKKKKDNIKLKKKK